MCYIIEFNQKFDFRVMTLTIEKFVEDIDFVKVWLTSPHDFLAISNTISTDIPPFEFRVPFDGIYNTQIRFKETIIKPLNCKTSDTEYVSEQQCLVNMFISDHTSGCPLQCLPIQMQGFKYVNKSAAFVNCNKLVNEICNVGPKVWIKLLNDFSNCPKPCKITTYKDSKLKLREPAYMKQGQNFANFEMIMNGLRNIEEEALIYDTNDVIGAVGGSLGLFLGFSFFDVISKCLDNLIMPLINYLFS